MDIVQPGQQADALAALSLVEMLANVSTVSLFGLVFAALSERGLARFTFALNAVSLLHFARFTGDKKT
jgi:hypothetical protein